MIEKSAGCVIIKYYDSEPYVLLTHATGNWRFKLMGIPKGHIDQGESLKGAAVRETEEEVGITPNIIDYLTQVKNRTGKTVDAFIAIIKKGRIENKQALDVARAEVDLAKFYLLEKAIDMVYVYQRPIIEKAIEYIKTHDLSKI